MVDCDCGAGNSEGGCIGVASSGLQWWLCKLTVETVLLYGASGRFW